MEHSTADESDVAVADVPSTSGAHWANRDKDVLLRRTGGWPTPYRRPPAVNSYQDTGADQGTPGSWDAFAPTGTPGTADPARDPGGPEAGWDPFGGNAVTPSAGPGPAAAAADPPAFRPVRRDVPADPPTGSGRASFGVTDGPISGARPEPVSPAAPRGPVADPPAAGRGVTDLPAFADLRTTGDIPAAPARPAGDAGAGRSAADFVTFGDAPAADAAENVPGGIGDFINGPGREIRPHRVGDSESQPVEHRRSRLVTAAVVLLSAVVLLGGAVAGVAFLAGEDQSITSVLRLGSGDSDGKVATAPLDGRTAASFELIAATTKVTVRTQDLGDRLFRITSAGDSGTAPSPVLSENRVQLLLSPDGEGASGNVEVLLSTKVTWGLRFVGGTDEQIVDITGGKVSSIDIAGGSRRVDLRLSQPTGTVPVRVTGAVDELAVLSPVGSPVRVKVDSGAKTVAAGDKTLRDVKPGSTLTPKDWKAPNRYDVDAASRVTLLTVRNAS